MICTVKDGWEAIKMADQLHPDVVLMDLEMPVLDGMTACKKILLNSRDSRVLILSAHSEEFYQGEAIRAGAAGFVAKQALASVVSQAIRVVHSGRLFFRPTVLEKHQNKRQVLNWNGDHGPKRRPSLNSFERELLKLIVEDKANEVIADTLNISTEAVDRQRECLMEKLNKADKAALTRYAIGEGIVKGNVRPEFD
ncbi:MAG: DNA-binding response regulator [Puniceicoccaceae bacterium]|nr:MAG: DNA-binding response regulator [Puniceicoccaceae bacterium]